MKTTESLANVVKEVQSGNNDSFEKLYYESYKYLHTCVINIVKDENTAEDMLQEAYTEIFKSISQLNNPYDFLSWAATIANRKCFAYIKKQKDVLVGENTDEEGNETDYFESIPDDEAFIPENILDDQEKIKIIRGIIDDLTDIQRACVIGFYYNDQKQEEIASELNIPVNTVKSHLSRAKSKIKEAVGETEKKQGIKLFAIPAFLSLFFAKQTEVYAAEMAVPAMGAALSSAVSTASTTAAAVTSAGEASAATSTATVSSLGEASVTASTTAETVAGASAKTIAGAAAKGAATKAVAGTAVKAAAMAVKTKIIIAAAVGAVTIASVGGGTAVAVTEHHKTVEREARIQRELEEREKKAKEEERLKAEAESKAASEAALVAEQTDANAVSDAVLSEEKDPMMEKIARAYIKAIEEYEYQYGEINLDSMQYALVNISSTGYPQLVIYDYDMTAQIVVLQVYNVNTIGELVDLGDHGCNVNFYRDFDYYEKQDVIIEGCNHGGMYVPTMRYLDDNGFERYWTFDYPDTHSAGNADGNMYIEWIDESGQVQQSEHNKTCEECWDEWEKLFEKFTGMRKSIDESNFMSKEEMIAYLKTFLSDDGEGDKGDEGDFAEGWKGEWTTAYKKCLNDIMAEKWCLSDCGMDCLGYNATDEPFYFTIQDITDDGIPELLVGYLGNDYCVWNALSFEGDEYIPLYCEMNLEGYDPVNKNVYIYDFWTFSWSYYIENANNGEMTVIDEVDYDGSEDVDPGEWWTHNGKQISEQEHNKLVAEHRANAKKYNISEVFDCVRLVPMNVDRL